MTVVARGRQPTGGAPGRPRLPQAQKRVMLSVRITPGMRQRLAALAEETGRSLAQQTEFLLEQAMAGIDAVGRLEQIEQELDTLIGGTARSGKNLAKGAGRDA